jgi:hypothetical protein
VDAPHVSLRRSIRSKVRGSSPTIGGDGQSCAHGGPGPQPCRKWKDAIGWSDEQARNLELVSRDFSRSNADCASAGGRTQMKRAWGGRGGSGGVPGSERKKDRGESAGRRGGNDVPVQGARGICLV